MDSDNPEDVAEHAVAFAWEWADVLDRYCAIRMEELGIPGRWIGETEDGRWRAFVPEERSGGFNSLGITINSGCLNPDLLGQCHVGGVWRSSRLRDRIDAIIAHEFEELLGGTHEMATARAPLTSLPISDSARSLLHFMKA